MVTSVGLIPAPQAVKKTANIAADGKKVLWVINISRLNFASILSSRVGRMEHLGKYKKPRTCIGSRLLKMLRKRDLSRADCSSSRRGRHFLTGFFGQWRREIAFAEATSDRNDGLTCHFGSLG